MSTPALLRRQQWIVEPAYQWTVTRMLLIALLGIVVATLGLVAFALSSTIGELELWPSAVFLAVFHAVAWMVVVELVVIIPVVIGAGIYMTHRVVGPVGRMKSALEQIGEGRCDVRLKLRDGDVLVELADAINQLAVTMRDRQSKP